MTPVAPVSARRPFPGLRPFGYGDHAFFFGRSEQIYALYRLVDLGRFVAVVGSSGSGKSSLVRAGLLPLLDEESKDPGGRTWVCRTMRPGDAPLARLANELAGLSPADDATVSSARRARIDFYLRRSSFGITDVLAETETLGNSSFLLVVDQFEELFRYATSALGVGRDPREEARSRDEAARFVQLLLEASRSPARNVTIMLTMRSDFIGDCAKFHGLPEAVSAIQFLVPSLTRDQLEDVIRKPIERAGATIDPALVEILLNESGDELDQLPVLQHCLLRLWERAGTNPCAPGEAPTYPTDAGALDTAAADIRGSRVHLDITHYDAIGRLDNALSRHAEEIYGRIPGIKLAVEQVFRALAEIDRERRAIRRAIRFDRLLAETCDPGDTRITEQDLRGVVDLFRADDCSFLLPPRSEIPVLAADTRIDVGHEALLRRWERVSGDRDPVKRESADPIAMGWLRAEQQDGLRYRALLGTAEGEGEGPTTLAPRQARSRWAWWAERPRTEAWAERYGGGFRRVRKLLEDSLRARQRRIVLTWGAVVAVFLLVIAGIVGGYAVYRERQNSALQASIADSNFRLATSSADQFLHKVLDTLNRGSVSVAGARELLETTDQIIKQVRQSARKESPETAELEIKFLLTNSDLLAALGTEALQPAQQAKAMAQGLVDKEPTKPKWLHLLYASSFKLAEIEIDLKHDKETVAKVLQEFSFAQHVAQQGVAATPNDGKWKLDLALVHNRIGDLHQLQNNYEQELVEDQIAAGMTGELVGKDPGNAEWRRELASAQIRVGQAMVGLGRLDEAMAQFQSSPDNRKILIAADPNNDTYRSNSAASHSEIAQLLERKGDLEGSAAEFRAGIDIREWLSKKDPQNATWQGYLAPEYVRYAKLLEHQSKAHDALDYFRKSLVIRQDLATRDPENAVKQRALATLASDVADRLMKVQAPDEALADYKIALAVRERLAKAEPENVERERSLAGAHAKVGDAQMAKGDSEGALAAYEDALDIGRNVAGKDQGNWTWQVGLAMACAKVGETLKALGRTTDAMARYKEALAILDQATAKNPEKADWQALRRSVTEAISNLAPAQ